MNSFFNLVIYVLEQLLLVAPRDHVYAAAVGYAYDPVPNIPQYIRPKYASFPQHASMPNAHIQNNTIRLRPQAAGLPYRSSFDYVRAAKHWKANLEETIKVLELLATDTSTVDVEVGNGITLAKLAKKELRPGLENRMVIATSHMFPSGDERRIRIIATLMIMYFVFDDKIEESEGSALSDLRDDFFSRFDGPRARRSERAPSALQTHLDETVAGIYEEDAAGGNGGHEMLEALRGAFRCVHPEGNFPTVDSYLAFRRLNVGARFVIAAAKFTIKSNVDVSDARFARFLSLIGDHLGLVNDLASYEKEARALSTGETKDMINIVAVMHNLMSLPSAKAAKAAAFSYLLQVETWIMEEIEQLAAWEKLKDEEWWFLEAVFLSATGNTFFCMTSSRYGGEAAKIN
ncbi:isoprenoid synthase domain-containing protein [Bipolaris maydis]|nr:isoprenoid synthase domain-containing protein [Bipolaris maydis]KAJ5059784.1 isoprenoid synthase domain-containing protein [Bipolaris maydis]KAJ6209779.1 isoprenoid synthase domain-containing protein [Bipolaris maydis]